MIDLVKLLLLAAMVAFLFAEKSMFPKVVQMGETAAMEVLSSFEVIKIFLL